jgi:hypothetical protein
MTDDEKKKQEACKHTVIERVYNQNHQETNVQKCANCGKRRKDGQSWESD